MTEQPALVTKQKKPSAPAWPEKVGVLELVGAAGIRPDAWGEATPTALYRMEPSTRTIIFGLGYHGYTEVCQVVIPIPWLYIPMSSYRNNSMKCNAPFVGLTGEKDEALGRFPLCNIRDDYSFCNPSGTGNFTLDKDGNIPESAVAECFTRLFATVWNTGIPFYENIFRDYVTKTLNHQAGSARSFANYLEEWAKLSMEEAMNGPYASVGITVSEYLSGKKPTPRTSHDTMYLTEKGNLKIIKRGTELPKRLQSWNNQKAEKPKVAVAS